MKMPERDQESDLSATEDRDIPEPNFLQPVGRWIKANAVGLGLIATIIGGLFAFDSMLSSRIAEHTSGVSGQIAAVGEHVNSVDGSVKNLGEQTHEEFLAVRGELSEVREEVSQMKDDVKDLYGEVRELGGKLNADSSEPRATVASNEE